MATETDWLEYAKLAVAALTPIMTGIVGIFVVRLGNRMEGIQQLHQELLKKRLSLFEEIAPNLNDIYCFYQAVGHWTELSPDDVIKRKRTIDRAIQVNRFLFRPEFWDAYKAFEHAHFEMYTGPGQPAKLRLDMDRIKQLAGSLFKADWLPMVSAKAGSHEEQRADYQKLMDILGNEIRGAP
jgi:hypothetical protein